MIHVSPQYSHAQREIFFPTREEGFPKFSHVRKGRRQGITRGAAQAFWEYGLSNPGDPDFWFLPQEPGPVYILWGDTITANVQKYMDRYFMPWLKKTPAPYWKYNRTEKTLRIGRALIDFRTADKPENWEGFGYHIIFLNEAGIILEDDYLYDNTVLPMLMDYDASRLIAAGVPKGKRNKYGIHKFFDMYQKGLKDRKRYRLLHYNSYQNPFISVEAVQEVADVLDDLVRQQEIFGQFIDLTEKPFFYKFSEEKHKGPAYKANKNLPLLISFDFNVEPMTALISQKPTFKSLRIFKEYQIDNSGTAEICDQILVDFPDFKYKIDVTGDASGRNRSPLEPGLNHYIIIKNKFDLDDENIRVPDTNPGLSNSRVLCNAIFNKLDVLISEECEKTLSDCIFANVDNTGKLIKTKDEGRHLFDNVRYTLHEAFGDFLEEPTKYL